MRSVRARLAVYGVLLIAAFGGAYALGSAVTADDHGADTGEHSHTGEHEGTGDHGDHGDTSGSLSTGSPSTGSLGLDAEVDGHRLVLVEQQPTSIALRIDAPDGSPVVTVEDYHGAPMHLIAVRSDLTGFQHVHPRVDADGVWRAEIDLTAPGDWRIVAEVQPSATGTPLVLGTDVTVAGEATLAPLSEPVLAEATSMLHLADGLMVHRTGFEFDVHPTDGLEPYLGQPAHLIAVRAGDLAVAHLHPTSTGVGIYEFEPSLPGSGTYRLFLQVQRDGQVLTLPFTVAQP